MAEQLPWIFCKPNHVEVSCHFPVVDVNLYLRCLVKGTIRFCISRKFRDAFRNRLFCSFVRGEIELLIILIAHWG